MRDSKFAFIALVVAAPLLLLHAPSWAQHPEMNPSLLGVVSAPAAEGVHVLRVLEHSPADEAGLESGDVLTRVGKRSVTTPEQLDQALAAFQPGSRVDLTWTRDGERRTGSTNVIHWRNYRGAFLRGRARGDTGFEAPEWYAYAWDHGELGTPSAPQAPHARNSPRSSVSNQPPAPTRENTAGKVVVIHAFQSW